MFIVTKYALTLQFISILIDIIRSQYAGKPYRTFYTFDPRRHAILLIGGEKTGDDRFYDVMVPKADKIYDDYLKEIQEENND